MARNSSPYGKRSDMMAFVSNNDGAAWKGGLLLDERDSSYRDGIQAEDGTLVLVASTSVARSIARGMGAVQNAVSRVSTDFNSVAEDMALRTCRR